MMKGYKTVIANLGIITVAVGAMIGVDIAQETVDQLGAAIIAGVGALNVILRAFTNSAIFKKD